MRELTQKELITLQEKSYHPYSKVKVATNGREYILVKNDKGKKLGARFLSTFVDVPLIGGKTNKEIKDDSNIKESNTTQLGGDENYVNKLAEITNLHNTILSLEKEILGMDKNKQSYCEKKSKLDTLSHVLEKEIVDNKSILPDKNTIYDIFNELLI